MLAVTLVALAAVALRPSIRGNDGVGYYVYLASIIRSGDLDFSDDYRDFDALKHYDFRFADLPVSPVTGRPSNRYGIGCALFWAPFVGAVHLGMRAFAPGAANALTPPYAWAVALATAFWGSLGLALVYGRLRRLGDPWMAGSVLAALVFATPLGFYLYAHGSMSHGISFFAVAALMLAFEAAWRRPGPRALAWCGVWAALAVMIRPQDVTWPVTVGGLLGVRLVQLVRQGRLTRGRALGSVAALAAAGLMVFSPQLATWKILYGRWLSGPAGYLDASAGVYFLPWPRHLIDALVSERGGALAWHPVMLAGLVGLAMWLRRRGRLTPLIWGGLIGFGLQALLVGSWSMWWAGASFGNRFFISALPWLAVGMAWWLKEGKRRIWAMLVLALLIVWNMGLLNQYYTQIVPREDAVPWSQVIRQNLTDVPRWVMEHLKS